MKFLLLGSGGLLGRHLHEELRAKSHAFAAYTHAQLDITDRPNSIAVLDKEQPDVVINAAAFCSFEGCERDPEKSRRVNLEAPLWWSDECAKRGIHLVLFTSDYIFDGQSRVPYREEDMPNPMSVYAGHKAEIERCLGNEPGVLIFRPAWIFGLGGKTFLSLLPGLLAECEELRVASGKRGSCLHAADAAGVILELAAQRRTGIWNLVHEGETGWEEFAGECVRQMKARGLPVRCKEIIHQPFQALSCVSGKRPAYSVLDTSKLASIGLGLPHWRTGLANYLNRWVQKMPVRVFEQE